MIKVEIMKGYYLSERPSISIPNSIKAMYDADLIFENAGLTKIIPTCTAYPYFSSKHKIYKFICLRKFKRACDKLKDEYIFLQYPTNFGYRRLFSHAIADISRRNKVIFLINNLNGLKYESKRIERIDRFILRKSNRIISQNEKMSDYLHREYRIPSNRMMNLDFMIYLTESINVDSREKRNEIVYAGNIDDSENFIDEYRKEKIGTTMSVYGQSKSQEKLDSDNVKYRGKFPNDIVNLKLKGSFGLVWGGKSSKKLNGNLGNYARINSPHKASLYIVARLPIITSNEAAIAPFVERYNIGFTINSLSEIPEKIRDLTQDEYGKMVSNITLVSNRISKGKNLLDLIEKVVASS